MAGPSNDDQEIVRQLGALRWVHLNQPRAREEKLLELLDFQRPWLQNFLAGAQLGLPDLDRLSQEARRYRCNENPQLAVITYAHAQTTDVMPPFTLADHEIDGTVRYGDGEEAERMLVGPSWTNNCCAFSVAFMCALWSNLGRKVCDQLPQPRLRALSEPARLVRYVIAKPWSTQTPAQHDGYRDILIECLRQHDPDRWTGLARGNFAPALPLVELFYDGAPQMTYTTIRGYRCCDGAWEYQSGTQPRREMGIDFIAPGQDFAAAINELLAGRTRSTSRVCSRGSECTRQRTRAPVVLDRLPPSLVVRCPAKPVEDAVAGGAFTDLDITYTDLRGRMMVRYQPYLAVYLIGNHFQARVRRGSQIWEHDGFHKGRAYPVRDWIVPDAEMVLVQYEQASEARALE